MRLVIDMWDCGSGAACERVRCAGRAGHQAGPHYQLHLHCLHPLPAQLGHFPDCQSTGRIPFSVRSNLVKPSQVFAFQIVYLIVLDPNLSVDCYPCGNVGHKGLVYEMIRQLVSTEGKTMTYDRVWFAANWMYWTIPVLVLIHLKKSRKEFVVLEGRWDRVQGQLVAGAGPGLARTCTCTEPRRHQHTVLHCNILSEEFSSFPPIIWPFWCGG